MSRKLVIFCSFVVFMFMAGNCLALHTYAYANVYRQQHGANITDDDEDYGAASCSSFAYSACDQCPTTASGQASAQRTARGGLLLSHSATGSIGTVGENYTSGAGADGYGLGEYGDYIVGPGATVGVGLNLSNVSLSVSAADPSAVSSLSFTLFVDEASACMGYAGIRSDGIFMTLGVYNDVESFFDVYYDAPSNSWRAELLTTLALEETLPVESFFDIFVEAELGHEEGTGTTDTSPELTIGTQTLELVIPEGYELMPEPATLVLLGLGGLLMRRRR